MKLEPRRVAVTTLATLALATGAAACGSDSSRTMRDPSPDQTTTTRAPIVAEEPEGAAEAATFELTTTAFTPGDVIPDRHTCAGEDLSPPLSWRNVPAETQSLAIVVRDLSATVGRQGEGERAFVHWIVGGIDPGVEELPEGTVPEGAVESLNDFGEPGWAGPCPPEGSGDHVYELRIYALPEQLDLVPDLDPEQAVALIEGIPDHDTLAFTGTSTG